MIRSAAHASARGARVLTLVCALSAFGCGDGSDDGPLAGAGGLGGSSVPTAGAGGVAGMASAGAGGAGSGGAGAASGAPTFSAIFTEIFANASVGNCIHGACHSPAPDPMMNGNLQLLPTDPAASRAALVGVTSTSTLCAGMMRVVPGSPEQSLLVLKLRANPPCGMRMPIEPFGKPLSDAQMLQIETWIRNGAPND